MIGVCGFHLRASEQIDEKQKTCHKEHKTVSQYPTIVFVCEHGAAKSVIAATHFNQLAQQRGLNLRAVARGTKPEPEISQKTIEGLAKDGVAPTESAPQKLSIEDLKSAEQIISFCELPAEYGKKVVVEQWDDIPPVSADYDKARDAIVERLRQFLENIRRSS